MIEISTRIEQLISLIVVAPYCKYIGQAQTYLAQLFQIDINQSCLYT